MTALITSHVWRPPHEGGRARVPHRDRQCQYMNCRRHRTEHARSVPGKEHWW